MTSSRKLFARIGLFVLGAAALLSACTVDVEQPRPRPLPPEVDGGFCTREYAPVCGRRGSRYETFNNACIAREAGFRIVSDGQCERGGPVEEPICSGFDPVCAKRGSDMRTFANECRADQAGFRVLYAGECRSGGGGGEPGGFCTYEYAPVCARRGSRLQTFPNQCEAENAGYRVISDGAC